MGKHLCQQPTTIDWLVGIAIEAIAINQLKTFIVTGDAAEEYLNLIEQNLINTKHDWSNEFLKNLEYDKLATKQGFSSYYETNSKGKIRLSRDPWKEMRAYWRELLEKNEIEHQKIKEFLKAYAYLTYWQKKFIKARTILYWFYLPYSPEKTSELLDTVYLNYYEMAKPDFDWEATFREPERGPRFKLRFNRYRTIESLAGVSGKSYYEEHDIHLRHCSELRGSRVLVALRRYKDKTGHWPERLEDVKTSAPTEIFIDPLSSDSFVYKLTEENFKLYSKGKNSIDEDGEYESRFDFDRRVHIVEEDDWLIWPLNGGKTKKENSDVKQQ
jgi:hypothetical protein